MAIFGVNHNFLEGLSDFWQRFFNDADQLDSLYQGTAKLIGQAYLDLLSNVLSVSLQDAPVFNKEQFRLITLREDEIKFKRGNALEDDRWSYTLQDDVVSFVSLDNRVIEPTASLQLENDFELVDGVALFRQDPTDPAGTGLPLSGYARRAIDIAVGGEFDDTARLPTESWQARGVRKGDVIRRIDLGTNLNHLQTKRSDHTIAVVRAESLFVDDAEPLTVSGVAEPFVVLRQPYDYEVQFEEFSAPSLAPTPIILNHTRLDAGSVRVFAKAPSGGDVVEGLDYTVDYEHGKLYRLTAWAPSTAYTISYTWRQEVWPDNGESPRVSSTGTILQGADSTTRVLQMALWASDALIDRRTLANNFGALLGIEEASSEAYRAFLRGIFQLYILGPVLERIESALNVIVGLPVVRDEGEIVVSVVNNIVTTQRSNGTQAAYVLPNGAPLRTDLTPGLELAAFEPLTTAITVTDYIQDPQWWHRIVLPRELFSATGGAEIPSLGRRTVSATYIKHAIGAVDSPRIGDPGLIIGADEDGFVPPPGQPILRHRLSFILMDRYFKYHTFFIRFDSSIASGEGVQFIHPITDLNDLVFAAKPAHTFLIVQPATALLDEVVIHDGDGADTYYQPQRYTGADPDATELFASINALPTTNHPYALLGLDIGTGLGATSGEPDGILFTDAAYILGSNPLNLGDYFHYELHTESLNFSLTSPVSVGNAPTAPRTGRLVLVFVDEEISGRRLVENVDYSVNYEARTITRLTTWDGVALVSVSYVQLNIGNDSDAPPDETVGDVYCVIGGQDPTLVTGAFNPAAVDWLDVPQPVENHRDIGLVDRAVTITVTPA